VHVIETVPGFAPPIKALFGLANTPFAPEAFRGACEGFCSFDASSSDNDLWNFSLPGGARLIVGLEVKATGRTKASGWKGYRPVAVTDAILSICWWETFMRSQHESQASFEAERAQFDQMYGETFAAAVGVLGPPRIRGIDHDERRHQYAIWRGTTGLLIVQQSAYDPQFGLDINYWVHPWAGQDPQPTCPFIDWLCLAPQAKVAPT
jgi:hypothetical protein